MELTAGDYWTVYRTATRTTRGGRSQVLVLLGTPGDAASPKGRCRVGAGLEIASEGKEQIGQFLGKRRTVLRYFERLRVAAAPAALFPVLGYQLGTEAVRLGG